MPDEKRGEVTSDRHIPAKKSSVTESSMSKLKTMMGCQTVQPEMPAKRQLVKPDMNMSLQVDYHSRQHTNMPSMTSMLDRSEPLTDATEHNYHKMLSGMLDSPESHKHEVHGVRSKSKDQIAKEIKEFKDQLIGNVIEKT